MGGAKKQVGIIPKRGLGAVPVVNIEVNHRHTIQAMGGHRVAGRDGNRTENTKAHGALGLGVVSRGSHGAEGILGLTRHDRIHRRADRPSGPPGGLQ